MVGILSQYVSWSEIWMEQNNEMLNKEDFLYFMFGSPPYVPLSQYFIEMFTMISPLMRAITAEKCLWYLLTKRGWINFFPLVWLESWVSERIQKKHLIIFYSFDFLCFRKDNSGHYIHVGLVFVAVAILAYPKIQYFVLNVVWPLPRANGLLEMATLQPSEKPGVTEKGEGKLG